MCVWRSLQWAEGAHPSTTTPKPDDGTEVKPTVADPESSDAGDFSLFD